jgi:hypothetical protein
VSDFTCEWMSWFTTPKSLNLKQKPLFSNVILICFYSPDLPAILNISTLITTTTIGNQINIEYSPNSKCIRNIRIIYGQWNERWRQYHTIKWSFIQIGISAGLCYCFHISINYAGSDIPFNYTTFNTCQASVTQLVVGDCLPNAIYSIQPMPYLLNYL